MSKETLGYIVWGALLVVVLVPECLAFLGRSFVPFPGIARTATNLSARRPWVSMVILAGMTVLAVHLVFYPWPDLPKH